MINFKFQIKNSYETGRAIIPHMHNCFELVYYIKGSGYSHMIPAKYSTNQNYTKYYNEDLSTLPATRFTSNSYMLIPPNTLHDEYHEADASIITIGMDIHDKNLIVSPTLFYDPEKIVYSYIKKILSEYEDKKHLYLLNINSLLSQTLIHIQRKQNNIITKGETLDYILPFIDEHYTEDISVEKLAFDAGYCPDHFRILFKKKTGISPKNYILNKRIELAKELLGNTPLSIVQISEACGFERAGYFTSYFRSATDMTPKEWRSLHKNATSSPSDDPLSRK